MTGCLDQLYYYASFWWECFFTKMQRKDSFGMFSSKYFCHIFMVYLTKVCSFGYSFLTSQVSKLFMAIKKMIILLKISQMMQQTWLQMVTVKC